MGQGERADNEISVADLRANIAEVLNAAIRGRTTYITNRGRRVAAVVPLDVAEAASHQEGSGSN